jgi:hypothetical protein
MSIRVVVIAVLVALAAPASAPADHDEVPVPRDAAVVAGPLPSGATLVAFGHRGEVCIAIRTPDQPVQPNCTAVPRRAGEATEVYGFGDEASAHGGLVFRDVAQVDLRFADRPSPRALPRDRGVLLTTVAGEAYRGPGAGRVRFYLGEGPRTPPWMRRFLDAAGRTLAADERGFERPVIGRPAALARGRGGIRLRAVRRPRLAATPLDRGRLVEETCVEVVSGRDTGGGVCASPDNPLTGDLHVSPSTRCDRLAAPVVTSRRVRRVEAVLGDGRRARVALVDVAGDVLPGARAGALVVNGSVAVRRLEAFGAGGRRLTTSELRQAPPEPCAKDSYSGNSFVAFGIEVPEPKGPLGLRVRDEGARLCLSLGDFASDRIDCSVPPVDPFASYLLVRAGGGRTLIAGVLPPEVASVELTIDGVPRRVETTGDLPGYGGQYRDVSRFLLLELPGEPTLGPVRFLDAGGAQLERRPLLEAGPPRARGSRALAIAGLRLTVTDHPGIRGAYEPFTCVRRAGRPVEECTAATTYFASIAAFCSPRRLLVFGEAQPGTRSVTLRTGSGTRTARLRRVGGRLFYAGVLGPRESLRGIVVHGRATRVATVRLPPVARQCGYDANGFFDLRGRDTDLGESTPEIVSG